MHCYQGGLDMVHVQTLINLAHPANLAVWHAKVVVGADR